MKNIKDSLFSWKKYWFAGLLLDLLLAIPSIIIFMPTGNTSDYDVYKWLIYIYIVGSIIIESSIRRRFENHESTIQKMNEEIENLKTEINNLKNKDNE